MSSTTERTSFTCPICGLTTYHPMDVLNRYCDRCHVFHPDEPPTALPSRTPAGAAGA